MGHAPTSDHELWAGLFSYPGDGGVHRIAAAIAELNVRGCEGRECLTALAEQVESLGEHGMEELFTRTFDMVKERALEIGWHIHGENYARGVFLVRMRRMLRDHGIEEGVELPDHIAHVLAVIGRADEVLASSLAQGALLPALRTILEGNWDAAHPYRQALEGLQSFLKARHGALAETRS